MADKIKRINYLAGEIDAAYHDAALRFGLSDSSLTILYAICSSGHGCLLGDIYSLSGVRKQTINSALRKLEAEGIVYLTAVNGKKKMASLTEKGQELANRTAVRLIRAENEIFDSWPQEEYEAYLALMQKFLTELTEKMKEIK